MGPGNERGAPERTGGPGELNSSPPWKLYFNPCITVTVTEKSVNCNYN